MDRLKEYQDERWKERARKIRELDGHKCAMCGAKGVLHVHHLAYPPAPFHIWEATDQELVTLCPDCHHKIHMSPFRPYLNEEREICNYVDVDEYERMADKMDEEAKKFREEYRDAYISGQCCCANCINGDYCGDHMECRIRIEDGRDFYDTPPYSYCDEYKQDNL